MAAQTWASFSSHAGGSPGLTAVSHRGFDCPPEDLSSSGLRQSGEQLSWDPQSGPSLNCFKGFLEHPELKPPFPRSHLISPCLARTPHWPPSAQTPRTSSHSPLPSPCCAAGSLWLPCPGSPSWPPLEAGCRPPPPVSCRIRVWRSSLCCLADQRAWPMASGGPASTEDLMPGQFCTHRSPDPPLIVPRFFLPSFVENSL